MGARARAHRAVPPDQRRGRVRQVVSRRARHLRRDRRQRRRLDPLRLVDSRRAGAADDPDRRGAPLERRRARGVATPLGRLRSRRHALRGPRPGRLQDGSRLPEGARHVSERLERLRELLEEPLLITSPVNVLYLTGLDSSNVALFVEPERVRLFTDFRYIEAAQAVEGVEAVQTKRSLIGWLGEELDGRIGFESNVLPWSFAEQLREGGLDLVPRRGLVEQLRAVKGE